MIYSTQWNSLLFKHVFAFFTESLVYLTAVYLTKHTMGLKKWK